MTEHPGHRKSTSVSAGRIVFLLLVVLCNISCDQLSKRVVRQEINEYDRIPLWGDHFTMTKVENSGAFLSLGNGWPAPVKMVLLSLLPFLALGYGLYLLINKSSQSILFMLGVAFAVGGGIGNLYDRIRYGSVTDFLHINFGLFQTGIFNMADVSVMIGMFLIILDVYLIRNMRISDLK